MSEENGKNPNQEEFLELSRTIKYQMDNMVDFKRYLTNYSKQSFILFVMLTAEPKQYEAILNMLSSLEDLLERENYL